MNSERELIIINSISLYTGPTPAAAPSLSHRLPSNDAFWGEISMKMDQWNFSQFHCITFLLLLPARQGE